MRPLVLTDGVAMSLFGAALLAWMLLEVWVARRSPVAGARDSELDRGTRRLVVLGYLVGLLLAAVVAVIAPAAQLPGHPWTPVVTGLSVLGGGLALRAWSIRTLGEWFTYDVQVRPGQQVVRAGPYRRIRHPSYTGALLCAVGTGIALDNGCAAAVAVLVPLAAVVRRIGVEEAAMCSRLGVEYEDYRRDTKRLVPGLW